MLRALPLAIAALLALGGIAFAATIPDDALTDILADQVVDEAVCEAAREAADEVTRANTRPLYRAVLAPVIDAPDLATAKARAATALDVLARPGPADSAAKTLHTANRQMGAVCVRALRRHITATEQLLGAD